MLKTRLARSLAILLTSIGIVSIAVAGAAVLRALWQPSIERYADEVKVDEYRRSGTIHASDYLLETYWAGPVGREVTSVVTAPHLIWKDDLDTPSALSGFIHVADGTASEFSPYCNVHVFRIDRDFWNAEGRSLRQVSQERWGLSSAEAEALAGGRLDVLAVLVDSC
jgi:hypothetical protein